MSMGRGCDRVIDRVAASLGQLEEATINFQTIKDVSFGGVLFALPSLIYNGLFHKISEYFSFPQGFYGLKSILITLSFLVLLRVKSIEKVRYIAPGELGKLIGLGRIPEVKTLRRKVSILANRGEVKQWQKELSKNWMESSPELAGVLYIDGHVRPYYGKKTKLPRRYVSRESLCLRGLTDYWVNDVLGQPFFVITTPLTSGLISMLSKEIVPRLIEEVPNQPTKKELEKDPLLHRFTLVFDREGYSPEFFKKMKELSIACITYKKFAGKDWDEEEFKLKKVKFKNGEEVEMRIASKKTFLGENIIEVREIRKLTEAGHQTSIITTDKKSNESEIAAAMFSRWTQENFFKYMMQQYNIDKLMEYDTVAIEETKIIVNPRYREIQSKIRSVNSKLSRRYSKFGALTLKNIDEKKVKEYEKKKAKLQEEITFFRKDLEKHNKEKKGIPNHLTIGELPEGEKFRNLSDEKKQVLDIIKMIAYRAETALANIVRPFMSRKSEARAVIQQLLKTEVDIKVDEKKEILEISLHNLANKYSDRLVKRICDILNETETVFPGTNLMMFYKLVSD